MSGTNQRQSLRLLCQLSCALRAKPHDSMQVAPLAEPIALERLDSLAKEFETYCEQIRDRATLNALRSLQRQINHLQSAVSTNVIQQAQWTQDQQQRRLSLSFDGLEIEVLPSDKLGANPTAVEVLFYLPGLSSIFCTLQVTSVSSNSLVGNFLQIADADLRTLRRFVLVQDATRQQHKAVNQTR